MAINTLYNLDETRTITYEQTFILKEEDHCKKYLDHLPLKGTLQVYDNTEGKIFTIVDNQNPAQGQVYFEYRDDYDYVSAKGLLIFNPTDAAKRNVLYARYIPVASRVDANVINQIINIVNQFDGKIWTKEDLFTPAQNDIIAWTAINGRPELATEEEDGLLSKTDKKKLNVLPESIATAVPFTGINLQYSGVPDIKQLLPNTWGDKLNLVLGAGVIIDPDVSDKTKATIKLDGSTVKQLVGLTDNYIDALQGDTSKTPGEEGPSLNNKYVLTKDYRLSDARTPLAHTHNITDVTNLQAALDGKAASKHSHTLEDLPPGIKGDPGITPLMYAGTATTGAPDTDVIVTMTHDDGDVNHYFINVTVPKGRDGSMRWEDLTPEQREQLRGAEGDKGEDGTPAAVRVTGVHTGSSGTDVVITTVGPHDWFDPESATLYKATDFDITIPRGNTGDSGIPAAVEIGTVTTTSNNTDAVVTMDAPVMKEIGGVMYNTSKINFSLPRGPQGTAKGQRKDFTVDDARWSAIDANENYTLTINIIQAVPISLAFEEVSSGVYEEVLATVRYDADHVYVIADHKFTGHVWVDGVGA